MRAAGRAGPGKAGRGGGGEVRYPMGRRAEEPRGRGGGVGPDLRRLRA